MALIKCKECRKDIIREEAEKCNGYCENCYKDLNQNNENEENNKKCFENPEKKKFKEILIICLSLIVFTITIVFVIVNIYIEKKAVAEQKAVAEKELNEKLEKCYMAINDNYNYDEFKEIISTFQNEIDKDKAYEKLDKALANQIKELNNNYELGKSYELYDLIKNISEDAEENDKIQQIVTNNQKVYYYDDYIRNAKEYENKGNYYSAYRCYISAIREIFSIDKEKSEEVSAKAKGLKKNACDYLKNELNQKINANDYSSYYSSDEDFVKNSDDDELKTIYQKYIANQEQEKLAKEKARKKSQGVSLGMTKQDVLDSSWGEPKDINTSIGSWGTHEQWVYGNGNYLYFENGRLTSIQN